MAKTRMGLSFSKCWWRPCRRVDDGVGPSVLEIDRQFHDPSAGFPDEFLVQAFSVDERDISKPIVEAVVIDMDGWPVGKRRRPEPPRRV